MGKLIYDAQQPSSFLQVPLFSPAYMIFEVCLKCFSCEDSKESYSMAGISKLGFQIYCSSEALRAREAINIYKICL